jgi:hemin uptake protein HemP
VYSELPTSNSEIISKSLFINQNKKVIDHAGIKKTEQTTKTSQAFPSHTLNNR